GMAELIIAKQRNGPTGTVKLQFIGQYGKFTDWSFGPNAEIENAYQEYNTPQKGGTITRQSKMNQDFPPPNPGQTGSSDVPF
ncbi:MAG: DnaB-like helicase C-terminal domain-containing protein, partial [Bacteroidota bacterium]